MKHIAGRYVLLPGIFFLIVFALARTIFLCAHAESIDSEPIGQILQSFTVALPLDLSTTAYLLIIPILLTGFSLATGSKAAVKVLPIYYMIFLFMTLLVNGIDVILYRDWGTKLNMKALSFLSTPVQIWQSADAATKLPAIALVLISFILLGWLLNRMLKFTVNDFKASRLLAGVFLLLTTPLLVIGIRGGIQEIPVNQSSAYFSKNQTLNYAAINSLWNLAHSLTENSSHLDKNPYVYMADSEAEKRVAALLKSTEGAADSLQGSPKILTTDRPNIVFVVLEGWSSATIKSIISTKNYCPNLENLISEGLLFPEIHANGFRTDQGLVSILSGFPAQPMTTIVSQYDKFRKLPCIAPDLAKVGYERFFVFGGEPEFGNFKSYLVHNSFDQLIDIRSFPGELATSNLGVPDHLVFDKQIEVLKAVQEPFFSLLLTQSTHEPFDLPVALHYGDSTVEAKYLSSIHYADSSIGDFMQKSKQEDWYANTLFVFIADHGHKYPGNAFVSDRQRFRIPLLFFGEVIKEQFRGTINTKMGGQIDLVPSLLRQLDLPTEHYSWGKDLFNPNSNDFAFYVFVDGFGWVDHNSNYSWENRFQKYNHHWVKQGADGTDSEQNGRAFMQKVFDAYLEY